MKACRSEFNSYWGFSRQPRRRFFGDKLRDALVVSLLGLQQTKIRQECRWTPAQDDHHEMS